MVFLRPKYSNLEQYLVIQVNNVIILESSPSGLQKKEDIQVRFVRSYLIKSISKEEEIVDPNCWRWPCLGCTVLRPTIF